MNKDKKAITLQQYRQQSAHWKGQKRRANKKLEELAKEYIKTKAEYPIGTVLKVDCGGKEKTAKVVSYTIEKTGLLTPILEDLNGKPIYYHRPTIIDQQ